LAPYSLHDRHQYRVLVGVSDAKLLLTARHFSGEFSRFETANGEPERSPILSGFVANCDPTLGRDLGLYDVLRSVAGDAYV
jgi:hypothetical protein